MAAGLVSLCPSLPVSAAEVEVLRVTVFELRVVVSVARAGHD